MPEQIKISLLVKNQDFSKTTDILKVGNKILDKKNKTSTLNVGDEVTSWQNDKITGIAKIKKGDTSINISDETTADWLLETCGADLSNESRKQFIKKIKTSLKSGKDVLGLACDTELFSWIAKESVKTKPQDILRMETNAFSTAQISFKLLKKGDSNG